MRICLKLWLVYEYRTMCADSDYTKEDAELRTGGGDAVGDAARGDIKFSTTAPSMPALSSRLQVLHRFSYLLNKNSQV